MVISFRLALPIGLALALASSAAQAMGLGELSDESPEEKANADQDKSGGDDDKDKDQGEGGEAKGGEHETVMEKSAASKAVADKLFLGTSFGWVKASKSAGTWKSNGMSDLTVGYKLITLNPKMGIAGTYRYAPMAVSGTQDAHSYRGIWEAHYLGGRFNALVTPKINVLGSLEAGYVAVHMTTADGLPVESAAENGGASVALGAGADFALSDKWAFSAGPRVYGGFGSFTTFQVAAAAGFLF
jgi:hypothetical protein